MTKNILDTKKDDYENNQGISRFARNDMKKWLRDQDSNLD